MKSRTSETMLNVVFMGDFPYPKGMAGTKRVQHAIDALSTSGTDCSVIITRQSSLMNKPVGIFQGTDYFTIVPDLIGWRLVLSLPKLIAMNRLALRRALKKDKKNVLYIYGPPFFDNLFAVTYAKKIGYLVIFDIVEDYDYAINIARDWKHKIKVFFIRQLDNRIRILADGIVIISSALQRKYDRLTKGRIPLHLRLVSIDISKFDLQVDASRTRSIMFYSGSFGVKDGIFELITAFEILAKDYLDLQLVMTGRGSDQRMQKVLERIQASPVKDRIDYKGYVEDNDYYDILSQSSIPCMTRIDSNYANAGFPFKIGEYMATGRPVIASNISDVGNYFTDRHDILLVKPADIGDIVNAAQYLLNNPEKASQIGANGREKALNLFSYKKQGKNLYNFLKEL